MKRQRGYLGEIIPDSIFVQKSVISMPNHATHFNLEETLRPIHANNFASLYGFGNNVTQVTGTISRSQQ
jgi:hypothetical protein